MEAPNKYIDLTYLKELSNGSNEFILQMISIFMTQTPEAIEMLEKYLQEKNWDALYIVLHKMKPSYSFMGIKGLEDSVHIAQENCKNKINLNELPPLILKIKNACVLALQELEIEKKKYI